MRVSVICTGNICRSPMGEVVLRELLSQDSELSGVEVTSAGTARWHVGKPMDTRSRAALDRAGYTAPGTLGVFADTQYLDGHDLVVVMTREHVYDVRSRLRREDVEVILLRDLISPHRGLDVPDPYYGDADEFDECLATITQGCRAVLLRLREIQRANAGQSPAG